MHFVVLWVWMLRTRLDVRLSHAPVPPVPPGHSNGANRTHCPMQYMATQCSPTWTLSTSLVAKARTGEVQAGGEEPLCG